MEKSQLTSLISDMFNDAGIEVGEMEISPIYGGGNNKVVSVQTQAGKFLVKIYYRHPSDKRNRLAAEYSFLSYALNIGLNCIPKPIFCNHTNNMGLYEFIEGRKLASIELTRQHIMTAARFIRDLNTYPNRDETLPVASEGCFSIKQHFLIIDNRLNRLLGLPVESELEQQVHLFVGEVENTWKKLKEEISAGKHSIFEELRADDRCISPSDFGFHNALLKNKGGICFIDFEYAGWDDPAKMVADFFLQPAVPVSLEHFDSFISEALNYSENKTELTKRANLLFPVFKIKWCCLMLNEFLPDAAKRREFANPNADPEKSRRLQFDKTQHFFLS